MQVCGLTSPPCARADIAAMFVQASGQGAVERVVAGLGFRVVRAALPGASDDPAQVRRHKRTEAVPWGSLSSSQAASPPAGPSSAVLRVSMAWRWRRSLT